MKVEQIHCDHVFSKSCKCQAVIDYLWHIGLDRKVRCLISHVQGQVLQSQFDVQKFDSMEKILILWLRATLLIQGVKLIFRNFLLEQNRLIRQTQIQQLHGPTQPYLWLLVTDALVNQLECVIDPRRNERFAKALLNHKLLIIGNNLLVLVILDFDLVA